MTPGWSWIDQTNVNEIFETVSDILLKKSLITLRAPLKAPRRLPTLNQVCPNMFKRIAKRCLTNAQQLSKRFFTKCSFVWKKQITLSHPFIFLGVSWNFHRYLCVHEVSTDISELFINVSIDIFGWQKY